ncbi:hypothetical protein QRX50_15925 [Amycolatopsis carbonis]|uniref:Uncharacterized protein n=1 Tax=Amycolatopsis carbonis TaxID=715471 RepID=A0A9Y2MZ02_9PSEU|nr:hypothetical protein [Amycolatopsis sp. 2-15]WIX82133.1 hypothetical protein QRX50_15925 [Amycolatopsis sp. 2-15]
MSSPTTPTMLRSCSAIRLSCRATATPCRIPSPPFATSTRTIGSADAVAVSCRSCATATPSSDSRSAVRPSGVPLDDVSASRSTSVMYGRSGCTSCSSAARRFWSVITESTCRMVSSAGWYTENEPSEIPTHSVPVHVSHSLDVPQWLVR